MAVKKEGYETFIENDLFHVKYKLAHLTRTHTHTLTHIESWASPARAQK